ncbi:MAG: hypothetical protein KGH49_01390 [Candidatus Micrarchaeota archaeon]|nr:hypothetical protein [Candidatus Micrarchaeota archaeon]
MSVKATGNGNVGNGTVKIQDMTLQEALRKESQVIKEMLESKKTSPDGFHMWLGKNSPGGKSVRYVVIDENIFSPRLVEKLVNRGVNVLYLGREVPDYVIAGYVRKYENVVLATRDAGLDLRLGPGKSMLLTQSYSCGQTADAIAYFAKQ